MTTKPHPVWDLEFFWMVSPKVSDFFEGILLPRLQQSFMNWMTTHPHPVWDLEIFWTVSPKVSDFFEGNSTAKTLTKFDAHQTLPCLGLRNFFDGLTESVRLF